MDFSSNRIGDLVPNERIIHEINLFEFNNRTQQNSFLSKTKFQFIFKIMTNKQHRMRTINSKTFKILVNRNRYWESVLGHHDEIFRIIYNLDKYD